MTTPDQGATAARAAYQSLEPIHLVTYFSPLVAERVAAEGLSWRAGYVGMRAAPLGPVPGEVVTATFFNWNGAKVARAWAEAVDFGLERLGALRSEIVGDTLRDALGASADSAELADAAARLREVYAAAPAEGRALAAAWLAQPWPEDPVLSLWHGTTIAREWRGDGHIAALVAAGLGSVEALVLHEAQHPDPSVKSSRMGAATVRATRGWDDAHWAAAVRSLWGRGLIDDAGERLTDAGARVYDEIEARTDAAAASVWLHSDADPMALLQSLRPYSKAVIDTGFLPGTQRRRP
ncbi:SCO6745 family protein [Actinomycetota bacterium]